MDAEVCNEKTEKEVADMIKTWLNTPYVNDDVNEDILIFARGLTKYFKDKT